MTTTTMTCPTCGRHSFTDEWRERAMVVIQGGIANVFAVDCFNLAPHGRNARRLLQSDFRGAAYFAQGLGVAGITVRTVGCHEAGDIKDAVWTDDLGPFRDEAPNVHMN